VPDGRKLPEDGRGALPAVRDTLLPGLLLIAFGVLILLVPALLVWLIALACIGMGIMMLIFTSFMSRMGKRIRRTQP